jgi:predicted aldo/keto reductase-like oxidoreductase
MKQVALGRTGIEVGVIGFGALQIATKLGRRDSTRLVHHAVDCGITLFDTARAYADSEERLGRALKGSRRSKACIVTKSVPSDAKSFAGHIEDSLRRLRTDCVDVYMVHSIDSRAAMRRVFDEEDIPRVLEKAKKIGKIHFTGFSGHVPDVARDCIERDAFDAVMYPLSFVNREARSKGVLAAARRRNVAFLSMKPFGGGRIHRADWAISYVRRIPEAIPVIGFERTAEIDEVIRLYHGEIRFTAGQTREMERFRRRIGRHFCRGCGYCLPCPEGIPITAITFWPVMCEQMGPKRSITKKVLDAVEAADKCTGCGRCVERCPYSLDIPGMLRKNVARIRTASAEATS